MKNKRFTIFRLFARLVAKANFWGFWALKGPIFIILSPVLFNMLYNVILHLSMKFGGCKFKNKDFIAQKPHFSEKISHLLRKGIFEIVFRLRAICVTLKNPIFLA